VFWSEEDEEFAGLCSEFPGMSWLDKDHQKAFSGIVALVQACLNDLEARHEPIPLPLSKKQYIRYLLLGWAERLRYSKISKIHKYLKVLARQALCRATFLLQLAGKAHPHDAVRSG
jgi:predicted RNase H-like HicB family nuclease